MERINLLEAYKSKLSLAESVYAKTHNGETAPMAVKLATAKSIQTVTKFLNENLASLGATQLGDMGAFKRAVTSITTITLPSLIAPSLVHTIAMPSRASSFVYMEIVAGSNKGGVKKGDLINNPFALGNIESDYSGARVVEDVTLDAETKGQLAWSPVLLTSDNKLLAGYDADGNEIAVTLTYNGAAVTYTATADGVITVTAGAAATNVLKVKYIYDNAFIPARDIPTITARERNIPLYAKVRRLAIYYSQLAAFQSKQDYGMDLEKTLSTQAVAELQYQIDTEVCDMLVDGATEEAALVWSKTLPIGVSKRDHFDGFSEMISLARSIVFKRTQKYAPNWMLCAPDVLPVLKMVTGFRAAPASVMAGPYLAGEIDGMKVFVSAHLEDGVYCFGAQYPELQANCGVLATYMPIVPTMLVMGPDGGATQGFSSMYDCKVLNPLLLVKGRITA